MSEHLPWINHLAASEAGVTLVEFAALTPDEQKEWKQFVLYGPSRLRDTLMIAQIRNLVLDFMTGSKTLTPVDEGWVDGLLEHPQEAVNRAVDEAKARKKKAIRERALALHESEQRAESAAP